MKRHNYKNLYIWKDGIDLADQVYDFAEGLPDREKFGLWSQMTRAGVSIPSNIAEGSARGDRSFKNFLRISLGSAFELETQLFICKKRAYGNDGKLEQLLTKTQQEQKMIINFMNKLQVEKGIDPKVTLILCICSGLLASMIF